MWNHNSVTPSPQKSPRGTSWLREWVGKREDGTPHTTIQKKKAGRGGVGEDRNKNHPCRVLRSIVNGKGREQGRVPEIPQKKLLKRYEEELRDLA